MLHRLRDRLIVRSGGFRDHVELVGGGKFDIAVSIAEQLGEFGFERLDHHQLGRNLLEQGYRLVFRLFRCTADDLRHRAQFLDAVTLHHAFRAERDLELATKPLEIGIEPCGRPGIDGRTQNQQLPVVQIRQQSIDAILHRFLHRVEELVDRCADGDNDRAVATDRTRRRRENEPVVRQGFAQQRRRAMLDERQLAGS